MIREVRVRRLNVNVAFDIASASGLRDISYTGTVGTETAAPTAG